MPWTSSSSISKRRKYKSLINQQPLSIPLSKALLETHDKQLLGLLQLFLPLLGLLVDLVGHQDLLYARLVVAVAVVVAALLVGVGAQEELETGHHDLGELGEAPGGDDVDGLGIVPHVLGVQIDHYVDGHLGRPGVGVLEHLEHEVLEDGVDLGVLVLGVDVLDVGDYVGLEELAQCLVLAAQELEEEAEEGRGLEEVLVAQEDEGSAEGLGKLPKIRVVTFFFIN